MTSPSVSTEVKRANCQPCRERVRYHILSVPYEELCCSSDGSYGRHCSDGADGRSASGGRERWTRRGRRWRICQCVSAASSAGSGGGGEGAGALWCQLPVLPWRRRARRRGRSEPAACGGGAERSEGRTDL